MRDSLIERLDRVTLSKRGDPSIFVANQAALPQKGQFTARAQFHRTASNPDTRRSLTVINSDT